MFLKSLFSKHAPKLGGLEILRYIGPGLLVTVGFIDPGNWASNVAAGSAYGYSLLWMVTLSTLMLIVLQHEAAHLGIVTGLCLSEASAQHLGRLTGMLFLLTAVIAAVCTALAEILGAAIGLNMLLGLPVSVGAVLCAFSSAYMLLSRSYRRLERWIIGFVSLIGVSFLFELTLVQVGWKEAFQGWSVPSMPAGSLPIVMSVLGAVVMPHNIFLHSEIIQSRQWNLEADAVMRKQLKYEFTDTLLAMIVGWAINSAMIIMAASVFYTKAITVGELSQAQATLKPLLGEGSAFVFGLALVLAGFSSSITAAMAGSSIFAGIFGEPFDPADNHSRAGVVITLAGGLGMIFLARNTFQAMIWSQVALSMQLPFTIYALIYLTSSKRVMGRFANPVSHKIFLWVTAVVVTLLNVMLLAQLL